MNVRVLYVLVLSYKTCFWPGDTVASLNKVANPMGERTGSYSFVSPEGEVVEVSAAILTRHLSYFGSRIWPILFYDSTIIMLYGLVHVFVEVHYTAGTDGYVILNKEELPQELPFSVCNQSPPNVQVNISFLKTFQKIWAYNLSETFKKIWAFNISWSLHPSTALQTVCSSFLGSNVPWGVHHTSTHHLNTTLTPTWSPRRFGSDKNLQFATTLLPPVLPGKVCTGRRRPCCLSANHRPKGVQIPPML